MTWLAEHRRALSLMLTLGICTSAAACANLDRAQVTSQPVAPIRIEALGPTVSNFGSAATTLPVAPHAQGDVMVVLAESDYPMVNLVAVTGGGVVVWKPALDHVGTSEPHSYSIWYGVVSTPGSATVYFLWSAPITGHNTEYVAQEFKGGTEGWLLDNAGVLDNPASSAAPYPALAPSSAGELYFGYADYPTTPAMGVVPGYAYVITPDHNQVAFGVALQESPRSVLPASAPSTTVGILLAPV